MTLPNLPGLSILDTSVNSDALNFRPNTWPPEYDFPVVIDSEGNVISRYSDVRWDLSPWHKSNLTIYFGDGPGNGHKISKENADLLRLIMAWWLWGPKEPITAKSLAGKFASIKHFFVTCSKYNICVSDLSKHPKIIKEIALSGKFGRRHIITYLHDISFHADNLGFTILDSNGMKIFIENFKLNESTQTAYIPARIWSYQLLRLKECLDDYLQNKERFAKLFKHCLLAYDLADFDSIKKPKKTIETTSQCIKGIATDFGVYHILEKWVVNNNKCNRNTLSSYLSLINFCGTAYIINFSLMRVSECSRLRADCLEVEIDETGSEIYLVKGITTKTTKDQDARWIVPSLVKNAISAMNSVTKLRLIAAKYNSNLKLKKEFLENPTLQCHCYEPWRIQLSDTSTEYITARTYREVYINYPKLFDKNTMRITEEDLDTAHRLTANLDPKLYDVGKIWPIAWHQLRRTGAVNMLASGLVSEFSLQYQLKHASLVMSRYYGQNYYKLKAPLNSEVRNLYLREMYESIARDFVELQSDNHISPHGDKRKAQILSEITEKDHKQLIESAKKGKISYRETFLGGCANQGPPCPYGGISNISSCMGFDIISPCDSVIIDKNKLPVINQLKDNLQIQLINTDDGSPLYQSLKAQLESAKRAINVINTVQI